jgi:hypothetical protein
MSAKTETCPNKKCPYRESDGNLQHVAYDRKHVDGNCHLCPHCESRMKEQ